MNDANSSCCTVSVVFPEGGSTFWWIWIRRPDLSWLIKPEHGPFLLPIWCDVGGRGPSDHRDKADLEEEKAQGQMYCDLRSSECYYLAHKAKCSCKILRRRSFWEHSLHHDCIYPHVWKQWHSQRHHWNQSKRKLNWGYILFKFNQMYLCDLQSLPCIHVTGG